MSIADEPDDTPGASNRANPPGGDDTGGEGGEGGGGGGADAGGGAEGGGGTTSAVAHDDRVWWLPYAVAVAVLVGYVVFLNRMIANVAVDDQTHWDRYLYLFGSVEALAFTAAGFFFGREVNRGRAQAAESRAKTEASRAAKAENKAADANARATALSDNVRAMFEGTAEADPAAHGFAPPGAEVHAAPAQVTIPVQQARGVIALADRWFPRR